MAKPYFYKVRNFVTIAPYSVTDLGEGPADNPLLFWVKRKFNITEERKAGSSSNTTPPLLPKLKVWIRHCNLTDKFLRKGSLFKLI